ncbi:MAG: hypothetical protein WCP57_11230 [Bacteroidota bacterium]
MNRKIVQSIYPLIVFLFLSMPCFASSSIQQLVFSSQKYAVVTAVVLVIFIGMISYLIYVERKIKKVEDKLNKKD